MMRGALLTFMVPMATNAEGDLSWLAPVATGVASIVVAAIGGAALIWRHRQERKDSVDDRVAEAQPTVTDGWDEVRKARAEATTYYNLYRAFEELYYRAISALRHLVRGVHEAHPETVFDKDVTDALASKPPETT